MIDSRIDELLQEDPENSKQSSEDQFPAFNDESLVSDFDKNITNDDMIVQQDQRIQHRKLNPKNAEFVPKMNVATLSQQPQDDKQPSPIDSPVIPQILVDDMQTAKLPSGNIFTNNQKATEGLHNADTEYSGVKP